MYKATIDQIENIGERLKNVRQYLIMTQQQVSQSAGIPVITISKIEHNKIVNSDSFIKILQFYSNWKSHTNLTHPGKYFRPSKVKIMRPTSPK